MVRNDYSLDIDDDARFEQALEVFDRRRADAVELIPGSGLHITSSTGPLQHIFLVVRLHRTLEPLHQSIHDAIQAHYGFRHPQYYWGPCDLTAIAALNAMEGIDLNSQLSRSVRAALLLLGLFPVIIRTHSDALSLIVQRGYLRFDQDDLLLALRRQLPSYRHALTATLGGLYLPESSAEMLNDLRTVQPACHPIPLTPIVTRSSNGMLVDFHAASHFLMESLRLSQLSGHAANQRAGLFEDQVQALVDASPWAPHASLRAFRGRQLPDPRRSGQWLGEIDAIGRLGDTLLIIECQSRAASAQWSAQEYRAVRELRRIAIGKFEQAEQLRLAIQSDPAHRDLIGSASRVLSLACLPIVPFLGPDDPGYEEVVPGLRGICVPSELQSWLARGTVN